MSFALSIKSLSSKRKRQIERELSITEEKTEYKPSPNTYKAYNIIYDDIHLPIGQWRKYLSRFPYPSSDYERVSVEFCGELFTKETDPKGRDQDVVVALAMERLKKEHSILISCHTGFGKTASSIYLFSKLKYKTAILCHLDSVKGQWPDEIEKFTRGTCKVQMVRGKIPLDPDADVYIFGIFKAAKFLPEQLTDIGCVVVDEVHLCTVKAFTQALLRFTPRYLIGLSATPDRNDGMDRLFDLYFGTPDQYIIRSEVKNFKVIKYQTCYRPNIKYVVRFGKTVPDWNEVVNSIEKNVDRQKEIAALAINHPEHKIIILCNRTVQTNGIYDILKEAKESVDKYVGNKKTWDRDCRILVAGLKKAGVGLNDPKLTMMILASDVTDVRQNEGRIRTTNNLIFDIVDYYKPFEDHWDMREEWYLSRGAEIEHEGPEVSYKRKGKKESSSRRFLKPNKNEK